VGAGKPPLPPADARSTGNPPVVPGAACTASSTAELRRAPPVARPQHAGSQPTRGVVAPVLTSLRTVSRAVMGSASSRRCRGLGATTTDCAARSHRSSWTHGRGGRVAPGCNCALAVGPDRRTVLSVPMTFEFRAVMLRGIRRGRASSSTTAACRGAERNDDRGGAGSCRATWWLAQ
jgi:hypothetical protein